MQIVLAWFADQNRSDQARRATQERFDTAASAMVPATWMRHDIGGADWGVTVLHPGQKGSNRWPVVAVSGPVTSISIGLPIGIDTSAGPTGPATALLAGDDVHRTVVPPFGLLALDAAGRFAIQQDWLGMCRLFVGEADGVTALCTRPGLLAGFLHGTVRPDLDGWASYATTGHFGADSSPVRGTRLLQPGVRMTGRRRDGGGWQINTDTRYGVDDVVMGGFAAQGRPLQESLEIAADGFTRTAADTCDLYADDVVMGLSGGKDSRLIAASLVAAGRAPRMFTNNDTPAEGEIAQHLVAILRDRCGFDVPHELRLVGAPADVLAVGLRERTERLQRRYDHQFPSSYTTRSAGPALLPNTPRSATLSGVGGELVTGYWYPRQDGESVEQVTLSRLLSAVPQAVADPDVLARERDRITGVLDHAKAIGLSGVHLADYVYLVERVRRWYGSAYTVGVVTPYLSPQFVSASFALDARHKRERVLHPQLTRHLVPEWADVPYVSGWTGRSTAARIHHGDGIRVIAGLLDTAHGPIAHLLCRDAVEQALVRVSDDDAQAQQILQHFTYLAVASETLEPHGVRPATSDTLDRVTAARTAVPASVPGVFRARVVPRLRWIRRTTAGRRLWSAVRARTVDRPGN
jgi:hypothetical protein